MNIQHIIQKSTDHLKKKGFLSARLDSELLISHALAWTRLDLYLKYDYQLNERELDLCRKVILRRSRGEPVAYIIGFKDFYKHSFVINNNVLIPRPESECLVETVLNWAKENTLNWLADFGSGSGCLGLSLLSECPLINLISVDISSNAIAVTKENAKRLSLTDRISCICKDIVQLKPEDLNNITFDVVVANPPYIAKEDPFVDIYVKTFEPHSALFSEENGLKAIREWSKKAFDILRTNGLFVCEIGFQQATQAMNLLKNAGFKEIAVRKDNSDYDRLVMGVKL